MRAATITFTILAVLMCLGKAGADEETDARVRKAFTKAWAAKHDTKTDHDELAVKLYREAWLGSSYASVRFSQAMASKNKPYPDAASAESIIHGDYGDASTWRLWELTNDICLDYFTEHPEPVIKAMTKDLQNDFKDRQRVSNFLSEWQRYILFHQIKSPNEGPYLMQGSADKKIWDLIVRELYPVTVKRFQELKAPDPYANEPLAYLLRDLDDPRAIPVLLGKDGRDIQYFEMFLHLQHNRKADPGLVKLLSTPDVEVRWRATYALRACADPDMAATAIKLLHDESPKVRHEALYMSFFLLSPERPELDTQFKRLLNDPDVEVRLECVILLAQRKDVACAPAMLDLLRNEKIGEIPHNRLVQSMRDLTGDYFGYHIGSDAWQPTTPNNRVAIEKFADWIEVHKTKR